METRGITIEQAAKLLDGERQDVMLKMQLMKDGFRIMHYYGERILAHKSQVEAFCLDGTACCEGPELDRLCSLMAQNAAGYFHIYDVPRGSETDGYIDLPLPIITFDMLDDMDLHIERMGSLGR